MWLWASVTLSFWIDVSTNYSLTKKKWIRQPSFFLSVYSFFDTLLSSGQEKWKLKNNPTLPTLSYCLFSVDLMPIDVRIYMFLKKTPRNNFPFASFPLVQFLLIVLPLKVTSISNGSTAWVAGSQGRAWAGSCAHLVIEFDPSIVGSIY